MLPHDIFQLYMYAIIFSVKAEVSSLVPSGNSDNETLGESDLEEMYKKWEKYEIGDKLDR